MIKKTLASSLVILLAFQVSANNITSMNNIRIEMDSDNFSIGDLGDGSWYNIKHEYGYAISDDGTYCLEYDDRHDIKGPNGTAFKYQDYKASTYSSPTQITVNNCQSNNSNQKFSYANEMIKSSNGLCLTRLSYTITTLELIANKGLTWRHKRANQEDIEAYRSSYNVEIDSTVKFQTCNNNNNNQKWQLELIGSTYKIKSSEGCLLLSGHGRVIYDYAESHSSTAEVWSNEDGDYVQTGLGVVVGMTSFELLSNTLDSCSSNSSLLKLGNSEVVVVEKVVPIIIPM